jgi:hypothetical protein
VDTLTIDRADPSKLATFRTQVLGYEVRDTDEDAAPIADLGATELRYVEEHGSFWTVMLDPKGNDFCVLRGPDDGWSADG